VNISGFAKASYADFLLTLAGLRNIAHTEVWALYCTSCEPADAIELTALSTKAT